MYQIERDIDLLETNTKKIYHVDISSEILAFKNIYKILKNSQLKTSGIIQGWFYVLKASIIQLKLITRKKPGNKSRLKFRSGSATSAYHC